MQLQSLFSKKENSEKSKELELKIPQLIEEVEDYFKIIKNLSFFDYSKETNKFTYTAEGLGTGFFMMLMSNALLLMFTPGNGISKAALIFFLTCALGYKTFNKRDGIFSSRIKYIKSKTETLKALLQNDSFKISLIVNIEKEFNSLEEKFQSKPETLSMVKKKHNEIISELKTLLIEENLSNLERILTLLKNMKDLEGQIKKLLKLENLNEEVHKQLNSTSIFTEEEKVEVDKNFKSLL